MDVNKTQTQQASHADDEIDLRELFAVIWKGKWIIALVTAVFAVGSVLYALSLPNKYTSTVVLAPVEANSGGMNGLKGQLGGLASLAGINLGSSGTNEVGLALEIVKSKKFIGEFISENNLLPQVVAANGWNQGLNELTYDEELFDPVNQSWLREASGLRGAEPSLIEAHEVFVSEYLSVSQNLDTGLVTASVTHYSPYIAAEWATKIVTKINQTMRDRAKQEARKSIDFLQDKISETNLADLRTTLYQLIEDQTQTLMFAEVREEYLFSTLDPAVIPEVKSSPKRALIVIVGTILGGFLSLILVLALHFFSGRPTAVNRD